MVLVIVKIIVKIVFDVLIISRRIVANKFTVNCGVGDLLTANWLD